MINYNNDVTSFNNNISSSPLDFVEIAAPDIASRFTPKIPSIPISLSSFSL